MRHIQFFYIREWLLNKNSDLNISSRYISCDSVETLEQFLYDSAETVNLWELRLNRIKRTGF